MPQPKPLRDMYKLIKGTKKDLRSNIKPLLDYAVRGNQKFIEDIPKVNWETLSSKDTLVMVLMTLSYGLKTNKKVFEDYIKKENMKSSVSLFHFMLDGDGQRIKNCLNTGSLINALKTIFTDPEALDDTLEKIHKRVTKIKLKDFSDAQHAQIEALINSIIEGKNIDPEFDLDE